MLQGHGNNKYSFVEKIKVDFSSNVWFQSMPDWFYQRLNVALKKTVDYPDPNARDLVAELATFHNLSEKNIRVTNGSVEGIYLLAQVFEGKKSAIIYPCFSEYEDACKRYNHKISFYSNKENWQDKKFSEELVWFGNPNNPDGKTISFETIENLLVSNSSTTFIIDEAFADLSNCFESAISLLHKYPNLIILRSFTKSFAIAGLRLGYVLAQENVIAKLTFLSIPWSVNMLALEAGRIILENYTELLPDKKELENLIAYFHGRLSEIAEFTVELTNCNYALIQLNRGRSSLLKKHLIIESGILIRDCSNFRGLNNRSIRLSVQKRKDIDLLISAVKKYYNEFF